MRGVVPEPLRTDDPREIAGYPLYARIGEGGMGTVYLSRSRGGQPVALKLVRPEYADSPAFRERFAREVAAGRQVSGYHLVPIVDHDAGAERPWLATHYVPGVPLDQALETHGPLPVPAVLQLLACAAYALDAVHTAGVIHRDVKPANLLLAADGPWLLDFGIARAAGAATLTTAGRLIGTPSYMSPEHALGRRVTSASDVFALGLIAAVAATGRHPYGRGNPLAIATRIAATDVTPPALDGVDRPLVDVVRRCLTADPAARPSAAAVAEHCAGAARRDVRDFTAWLPGPVATSVTLIETAFRTLSLTEAPTARRAPLPPTAPLTVRDEEWRRRVRREP
ncbi:serine/threonine-protein kinase [Streptomyces griseiscabiei]|uniref:Serine/threonine protein kinase n=1 Tax=Streptomyces griseiscabiei TaxID=2993540 RepID=A0ABU4KZ86_9ACTN|nr:serine/threonine-protein kinase [Streptomyces griseiscabiei]MBZ3908731.1 serine/threonine protein kinase [Streptomyces griseiscabiei]MDX2908656.1 serine/threonine protein kinase [Streptomyces griseiscabiei]